MLEPYTRSPEWRVLGAYMGIRICKEIGGYGGDFREVERKTKADTQGILEHSATLTPSIPLTPHPPGSLSCPYLENSVPPALEARAPLGPGVRGHVLRPLS